MGNEMSFKEVLDSFRKQLKELAKYVKQTKEKRVNVDIDDKEDRSEVIENLMFTYRHLEDASMRIGKTLQALAGGVSTYDNTAVGTPETQPDNSQNEDDKCDSA